MRVLIVSFYFPPAGGGGVQRVLKLCRHLPELGIEVDVLAPDDPKWSAVDAGLSAEATSWSRTSHGTSTTHGPELGASSRARTQVLWWRLHYRATDPECPNDPKEAFHR